MKRDVRGFGLIELMIVLVVLMILTTAAVVVYEYAIRRAHSAQDYVSLNTLHRASELYKADGGQTSGKLFPDIESDAERQQHLLSKGYIEAIQVPVLSDRAFAWDEESQRWQYVDADGQVIADPAVSYNFAQLSPNDFIHSGNWQRQDWGFYSTHGLIFIPTEVIDSSDYSISVSAKLDPHSQNRGGYGVLFETRLDRFGRDWGYAVQFDRGYAGGAIVVRKRISGNEGHHPVLVISNAQNSVIPADASDEWWTQNHDVRVDVRDLGGNQRSVDFYINDQQVFSEFIVENGVDPSENHTGLRSWTVGTEYYSLDLN